MSMPNQPAAIKFYIREIRVFKLGTVLEYFIDDVLLGRKPPVPNIEGMYMINMGLTFDIQAEIMPSVKDQSYNFQACSFYFKLLVRQIIWYLWFNAKYNID
jgi:hypothetical protein